MRIGQWKVPVALATMLSLAPLAGSALGAGKAAETAKAGGPASADASRGKLVYQASCAACHTSGLAGAPKIGDAPTWTTRLSGGLRSLYVSAIKGKNAMPPKGGNASLSDADLHAAVDYMLAQSRSDSGTKTTPAAVAEPGTAASSAPPPEVAAVQEAADPNAFNRLIVAPTRRNRAPAEDGIHDPANPGTALLQAPARSFQSLPQSGQGNYVNWVAALGGKRIQPRWDARDPKAQATVMDLTIIREVKGSMHDVVFPHKQHTEWLDCSNCHPSIFTPQKGSNQISMAAIMLGQKCGVCHGKVAFPISECRLCHARQKLTQAPGVEANPAAVAKP